MATSTLEGAVTSANHSLVKDGWCWSYRKYAPGDAVLEGLENYGGECGKGLYYTARRMARSRWRGSTASCR